MSGLDLGDNFLPDRRDKVMPKEGFVVEQGELGDRGLVEIMGTWEEPIGGTTSGGSEDVHKLVINVLIKTYGSKRAAKWENVEKVLRDQVVFAPTRKLDLFLEVGDPWVDTS